MGIAEGDVVLFDNLLPQIGSAFVGCIETKGDILTGKVVDEGATVRAETRGVLHNALGIESYDSFFLHKRLNTVLTMRKLVGTAMARTASGASSRLKPKYRNKLNNAICRK